jgi:hypothetical protein
VPQGSSSCPTPVGEQATPPLVVPDEEDVPTPEVPEEVVPEVAEWPDVDEVVVLVPLVDVDVPAVVVELLLAPVVPLPPPLQARSAAQQPISERAGFFKGDLQDESALRRP